MDSTYKILMSIELRHDYYSDGKCHDIRLVPSENTKLVLKNARMLYKTVGNTFLIIVKIEPDNTPSIPLPEENKLVFHLDLIKPEFMNISMFDYSRFRKKRFYISNLTSNISDGEKYLSAPLDAYDNAKAYVPGDMVIGGGGQSFECIKASTGNPTTDAEFWVSRGEARYVSDGDLIEVISGIHTFSLSAPSNVFTLNVFGLNISSGAFDVPVIENQVTYLDALETENRFQVNLSALPTGKYRVNINGEDFMVYLDDSMISANKLGVLEVFTHLANGADYALLDSNGKVWELDCQLRFANRRAYWKYYTPKLKVENIKVSGSNPAVHPFTAFSTDPVSAPSRKDFFVSNNPMVLSESSALNNFQLELSDPSNTDLPSAPKPEPSRTGILTKTNNDYYVHIHLNY